MKKILAVAIGILMFLTSFSTITLAAEPALTRDEMIDELYEQRMKYICREEYEKIEEVDRQLEKLGVRKLSALEAQQIMNRNGEYSTYVTPPTSTVVDWSTSTSTYTVGGKSYTVQTLTAQPTSKASSLKKTGTKTITSTSDGQAAKMNILTTAATATGSATIPGASFLLTLFDAASGAISGISRTTTVYDVSVSYTYNHHTTATFKYVKKTADSDDEYTLCLASTKGITSVVYNCPFDYYYNGVLKPGVLHDDVEIISTPSNYNSASLAIAVFLGTSTTRTAYVYSVTLKGPENKSVANIYPEYPAFPSQV